MTSQGAKGITVPAATALLSIGLGIVLAGCQSTAPEAGPGGLPHVELSAIEALSPPPEAGGVARLPTFAWRLPGRSNRVSFQIFNLYRADSLDGDAAFIRTFDGPIQRFQLNEGQEGMAAVGIGRLEPNTDYVWKLAVSYWDDETRFDTGEWRFRTGEK